MGRKRQHESPTARARASRKRREGLKGEEALKLTQLSLTHNDRYYLNLLAEVFGASSRSETVRRLIEEARGRHSKEIAAIQDAKIESAMKEHHDAELVREGKADDRRILLVFLRKILTASWKPVTFGALTPHLTPEAINREMEELIREKVVERKGQAGAAQYRQGPKWKGP